MNEIDKFLRSHEGSITVQSYITQNSMVEYQAFAEIHYGVNEPVEEICEVFSSVSLKDVLEKLGDQLFEYWEG